MISIKRILIECDIVDTICILTGKIHVAHFDALTTYYSFYRYTMETYNPGNANGFYISSYRKVDVCLRPYTYAFFNVNSGRLPIDMKKAIDENREIYVPDCFVKATSMEWIAAAFLYQLKAFWDEEYPLYFVPDKVFEGFMKRNTITPVAFPSVEKALFKVLRTIDYQIVKNEIDEQHEDRNVIFWSDILNDNDVSVMELEKHSYSNIRSVETIMRTKDFYFSDIPKEYVYYVEMSDIYAPDVLRGIRIKRNLLHSYKDLTFARYKEVMKEGSRIIVEENKLNSTFPFIYVRDRYGVKKFISDVPVEKLVCMDIHILSPYAIHPQEVLGKIMFYLEYPIRTKRIIREQLGWAIRGMLKLHNENDAAS